ncbi:unnamed protein product, partial [Allacma fusca]
MSTSYNFSGEPPAVLNPLMEARPATSHASMARPVELWFPIQSVSSLARLRWRAAHCLRFIYNCRRPKSRRSGPLVAA